MNIKEWFIKKLEKDIEPTAGHINLEELSETERNNCFIQFGEGDENLTSFLKTAYDNGAPSLFCCSGHGTQSAYVVLQVTDKNIELLRKVGKVLSKNGIATNFENNHIRGTIVNYRSTRSVSTEWLSTATQIMETPELFDDSNPEIYYHEEIHQSYKPFGFDLKKKLLSYLRENKKELPEGKEEAKVKKEKLPWELSKEEKNKLNKTEKTSSHQSQNQLSSDKSKER